MKNLSKASSLLILCMGLVLSMLLCGCQPGSSNSSPSGDDPSLITETIITETIEDDNPMSCDQPDNPIDTRTIAEICEAFRTDENPWDGNEDKPWMNNYETVSTFWITIDGTDYYYYHTYPSNEWTPEEVAQYFREHPYYWGTKTKYASDQTDKYYLWTPDYTQMFLADTADNWLYIDGFKSIPLDNTVSSMNPKDLVQAYQDREWDGITPRHSEDFSTTVVVNQEYGLLEYDFDIRKFSEERDPNHLAWAAYVDAQPWWKDASNPYHVTVTSTNDHTADHQPRTNSGYDSWDPNDQSEYYSTSDAWAIAYVDVPWDQQETLLAVQNPTALMGDYLSHAMYVRRSSDGLYALTTTGAKLWRAGVLRQTWKFDVATDTHILNLENNLLVYTKGRILELFDDGTIGVLLDNIVSINLDNFYRSGYSTPRYSPAPSFTLKDGVLSFNSINNPYADASDRVPVYKGSTYYLTSTEIAKNIVDADVTDWRLVLYTDASGKTYAIYDFLGGDALGLAIHYQSYQTTCLGEGSIADFKTAYETYASEHGRFSQNEFIEETAAAYATTLSGNSDDVTTT